MSLLSFATHPHRATHTLSFSLSLPFTTQACRRTQTQQTLTPCLSLLLSLSHHTHPLHIHSLCHTRPSLPFSCSLICASNSSDNLSQEICFNLCNFFISLEAKVDKKRSARHLSHQEARLRRPPPLPSISRNGCQKGKKW